MEVWFAGKQSWFLFRNFRNWGFKKDWNALSIIDMKLLLQQELYGPEWSHISTEDISISLDQFKINWQQSNENNNDNIEDPIEELGTLSELMHTFKMKKTSGINFHERLQIYTKLKRDEMEIREFCICNFKVWSKDLRMLLVIIPRRILKMFRICINMQRVIAVLVLALHSLL